LGTDVSRDAALVRGVELQLRIQASAHSTFRRTGARARAVALYREMQSYLIKASDRKLIKEPHHEIYSLLKLTELSGGLFGLSVGDVRNFKRDPQLPHFTRSDGGWFDFQLLVREDSSGLEIVAYDFELRLVENRQVSFLRFDVNLRAHLHLNSDDDGMAVPAPILTPFEIFDIFIHSVRSSGRVRRLDLPTVTGTD